MDIRIHQSFAGTAADFLQNDKRFIGMAIGGSWINAELDEYSDLDLYLLLLDEYQNITLNEKKAILDNWGNQISFYVNAHDTNVTVSLYDFNPLILHVDCKWITLTGLKDRVEDPVVIFEQNGLLTGILKKYPPKGYDLPDFQLNEMRFWSWMHYVYSKLGRGEVLEAHDYLCEIRSCCIGPMVLFANSMPPRRMRHAENLPEEDQALLLATIPQNPDKKSCLDAAAAMLKLYIHYRDKLKNHYSVYNINAEKAFFRYAEYIKQKIND